MKIVGDAPIFIAYQSAEVWARQELFELDADGRATVIAGVPPDFFSATGQRWGNPLYRWSAHAAEGYAWWIERVRRIFELVDIVRIDHFRGFAGYWEIPASEPNAIRGRWLPGPGAALFHAIEAALGELPIIAEDLGVITPDVDALRHEFGLPGMRILQFAFGEDGANDNTNAYLPHNYDSNTVVYTGTHDNNTTQGWWAEASPALRQQVLDYLGTRRRPRHPLAADPRRLRQRRRHRDSPAAGRAGPGRRTPHEPARPGRRPLGMALWLGPGAARACRAAGPVGQPVPARVTGRAGGQEAVDRSENGQSPCHARRIMAA